MQSIHVTPAQHTSGEVRWVTHSHPWECLLCQCLTILCKKVQRRSSWPFNLQCRLRAAFHQRLPPCLRPLTPSALM